MITRTTSPMTDEKLMAVAPSVFATRPWDAMSARYTFIPTIEVVRKMRAEGFVPVAAGQSRTGIEGKENFTKHMIRFRDMRNGDAPATRALGQIYPELVLTNAHDGGSAFRLDAGLFRLVCLNGMVVCDSTIGQIRARHTGSADAVIDASYEVIDQFPKVIDSVQSFARLQLTAPEQNAFADAALSLKYEENERPVTPEQILRPRRAEDRGTNLWNTMNVVQEALVNGGTRGFNAQTRRRVTTRAVNGISENTKLNKALWMLTEKMKELKG